MTKERAALPKALKLSRPLSLPDKRRRGAMVAPLRVPASNITHDVLDSSSQARGAQRRIPVVR